MSPEFLQQLAQRPDKTTVGPEYSLTRLGSLMARTTAIAPVLNVLHTHIAAAASGGTRLDLGAGPGSVQLLGLDQELRRTITEVNIDPTQTGINLITSGIGTDGMGIDHSVLNTRRHITDGSLVEDATTLPSVADGSVDSITAMNLVTVLSPQETDRLIQTMYRVLRPGGIAALICNIFPGYGVVRSYAEIMRSNTGESPSILIPVRAEIYERRAKLEKLQQRPWIRYFDGDPLLQAGDGLVHFSEVDLVTFFQWVVENLPRLSHQNEYQLLPAGIEAVQTLIHHVANTAIINDYSMPKALFEFIEKSDYSTRFEIMLAMLIREWQTDRQISVEYQSDMIGHMNHYIINRARNIGFECLPTNFGRTERSKAMLQRYSGIRVLHIKNGKTIGATSFSQALEHELAIAASLIGEGLPIEYGLATSRLGVIINNRDNAVLAISDKLSEGDSILNVPVRSSVRVLLLVKPDGSTNGHNFLLDLEDTINLQLLERTQQPKARHRSEKKKRR